LDRPNALVLFDIDGTLVRRAGPHHRLALVHAVRTVTGVDATTDGIPVQGMLDRDILSIMMRAAGFTSAAARRHMPEVVRQAQAVYPESCPDLRGSVCPGVRDALELLRSHGVVTGLVTGNLTRIGWTKIEQAGLREYFRFGAFAELARNRAGLARIAIHEARRSGWIDRASPITLIGDHENDILAARANKIRAVAVATGISTAAELSRLKPDLLLPDLRSLRLEMLL
jgi:phosphoglycolate phosphatase